VYEQSSSTKPSFHNNSTAKYRNIPTFVDTLFKHLSLRMRTSLLFFVALFLLSTCNKKQQSQKSLPEGFSVLLTESTGMLPYGRSLYLSPTECYEIQTEYGKDKKVNFSLNQEQLLALAQAFEKQNFAGIRSQEIETADRGGITLLLRSQGNVLSRADAGSTFILKEDRPRFEALLAEIAQIIQAPLQAQKVALELSLDASFAQGQNQVSVMIGNVLNYQSVQGVQTEIPLHLIAGPQEILVNVYGRREGSQSPQSIASARLQVNIEKQHRSIRLRLEGNEVKAVLE
jgi:hypothetical protein